MEDNEFHIGKLIEKKLNEKEHTKSWLARKLNCDRSNIYKIFDKKYIDMELLNRISIALDYDFYKDCSENLKKEMKE